MGEKSGGKPFAVVGGRCEAGRIEVGGQGGVSIDYFDTGAGLAGNADKGILEVVGAKVGLEKGRVGLAEEAGDGDGKAAKGKQGGDVDALAAGVAMGAGGAMDGAWNQVIDEDGEVDGGIERDAADLNERRNHARARRRESGARGKRGASKGVAGGRTQPWERSV